MSAAGISNELPEKLGLTKQVKAVARCRSLSKKDLKLNGETPRIDVNPETYEVRADGELLTCEPAKSLALTQRYFLF
jgi:urease subunit alpha